MKYDAIVIGGGAAGLYCAIAAGRRGRRVLVIEHNAVVGRKIIISGGGRCNFTNLHTQPENFVSANPHFCKSALARHTPHDFIDLVRKHGIQYYEKALGQLFCRGRSDQIVEMLLAECRDAGVRIETSTSVSALRRSDVFEIETNRGAQKSDSVVIASGGVSFAKIGASDFGYRIARQFGLAVTATRPSLVPLMLLNGGWSHLAGVSADASVSVAGGAAFRENILFTHKGISGPAILQISNYWHKGEPVFIDLMPDVNALELLLANRSIRRRLDNFLSAYLPDRLAAYLAEQMPANKALDAYGTRELEHIAAALNRWSVMFTGTESFDRAEVTLGGVSTDGLSSRTLEATNVPGLYFIGEVVDVTGWLGGYNFQWAWSSGHAAGQVI